MIPRLKAGEPSRRPVSPPQEEKGPGGYVKVTRNPSKGPGGYAKSPLEPVYAERAKAKAAADRAHAAKWPDTHLSPEMPSKGPNGPKKGIRK